jgi:diketogulonate reductase-like aldo/keto reductase
MFNKYLKYKFKYLKLKNDIYNQKGGNIINIPKLCFGTAQYKLENTLPIAIENNINHFDCADLYNSENKDILKENLKKLDRSKYWLTWKSNNITIDNIKSIISFLECEYLDLFLIHHYNPYYENSLNILIKARNLGLIKYYGVSNYENLENILYLKQTYNIYALQIQARPPDGQIIGKSKLDNNFIEKCNDNDIKIMLYATSSGFLKNDKNLEYYEILKNLNLYYLNKYIFDKINCLIISSISGLTIKYNCDLLNCKKEFINCDLNCFEKQLESLELYDMSH